MAITDTNVLKAKEAELGDLKDKIIGEHLASAAVRDVLAPLESEIAVLAEKIEGKKEDGSSEAS